MLEDECDLMQHVHLLLLYEWANIRLVALRAYVCM
jgi:hypothetical protein